MLFDFDLIILNIEKKIYSFIGSGSGRAVFDLGNGYVVKIAKNNRGIAQNVAEYQISSTDHSNFFAMIPQVSDNFNLLIMEKAERIMSFAVVRNYFNVNSNRELFRLKELRELSIKHNLILVDLLRPDNWGMLNGRPVIIDYGFTRAVKRRYYPFV